MIFEYYFKESNLTVSEICQFVDVFGADSIKITKV